MVALTTLCAVVEPRLLVRMFWMPAAVMTARTAPPAMTPVPSEAGFSMTLITALAYAVLAEFLYLTNRAEEELLLDPDFVEAQAEALTAAIVDFFSGAFALVNTGEKPVPSEHGLVTTIAWRLGDKTTYALEGSAFIAVGALHLPGDDGLLQLLEQQGYTVRVIY